MVFSEHFSGHLPERKSLTLQPQVKIMLATHRAHRGRDKSASARAEARGLHDGQADGRGRGGGGEAAADGGEKSHFFFGKGAETRCGGEERLLFSGRGGCSGGGGCDGVVEAEAEEITPTVLQMQMDISVVPVS